MPGLARESFYNWRAKVIESLKNMMASQAFLAQHRNSDTAFTRKRQLTLPNVLVLLMNQMRACLQTELDRFFQVIERAHTPVRRVGKAALCQARKKFSHQAFVALNREALDGFYQCAPVKRWHGYRVIAFDGSTHRVPQTQRNREHFGLAKADRGKCAAVARVSYAFDVLNEVIVDAHMAPYSTGERQLAVQHLDHLGPQDLLLLDQGYVATWMIHLLEARDVAFCCRVPPGQYQQTREFRDSGQREALITLPPSRHVMARYDALGLEPQAIQVRIVRVHTRGGNQVFLLTSLPHCVQELGRLYRQRWPVEEAYKRMKCRVEVENFSGVLPHTIYQDFHAAVLTQNVVAILSQPARQEFARDQGERRWARRLNWTQVLGKMKDTMVLLFTRADIHGLVDQLMDLFLGCWESYRPNRRFPRTKRMNKRIYYTAYKPATRTATSGRAM